MTTSTSTSTSTQRAEANRRNSGKSTGPTSDEGKRKSSRNALKHGLTSRMAVLPNEDPAEFQDRLDEWMGYYQPADPAQAAVIERAVTSKWRLDRCTRIETSRLSEKVRHAVDDYDFQKFAEVEEIGRRLIYEPLNRCEPCEIHDPAVRARLKARADANPAILSRQLQTSAQGVQWLIDRWVELAEMLKLHGFWHYPEKFRAAWMLGRRPEEVLEDVTVQRLFLACNVAHPDTSDTDPDSFDLWDECYQTKLGLEGKPMYTYQVDQVRCLRPPDVTTARARLWELFTIEITRLKKLKEEHLDPIARLDRASAEERAMFDGSKEGVLLRRYETACEREMHRSISDLMKLRKDPPREAESCDDGAPERNEAMPETPADEAVTPDGPPAAPAPAALRVPETSDDAPVTPVPAPPGSKTAPPGSR